MNDHIYIQVTMLITYIFTISFILTILPQSHCRSTPRDLDYYSVCMEQLYNCGNLSYISYPFWGDNRPSYCGGSTDLFHLTCNHNQTTTIFGSQNFTVLDINPSHFSMIMVRTDLAQNVCSPTFGDTYWGPNQSQYADFVRNVTISYNCSSIDSSSAYHFKCGSENVTYLPTEEFIENPKCKGHINVPTMACLESYDDGGLNDLRDVLNEGFELHYEFDPACTGCHESGGVCGAYDTATLGFYCYFRDHKNKWDSHKEVIIGVAATIIAAFLIGTTICRYRCMSSVSQGEILLTIKNKQDIETFLKNQGAQTLKSYKFSDVKKMTNSFKVKLGQGGFGTVYKGKLITGCLVAVKVLNTSKKNNEEFINEVASISRTSHVNVVTLLGFCLEDHKKALIYEFMPNGSLDKFIYRKEPENTPPLNWDILYQIALGIARGLQYLHRGCNTRILHFDIKPHNILLDENFNPKISDFGLAKLCPRNESIISMSDARGTLGYIAPEVWNRNFGGVSHKSDVYSYGMMLLEMVGGRKNINAEASHTSEIYFPHWVHKRLQKGVDLTLNEEITIEENEISKKMVMVGLWCIQTIPNDRPTMKRVTDMLEGNGNSLEMPPKPFLSSPIRSVAESSTSLN